METLATIGGILIALVLGFAGTVQTVPSGVETFVIREKPPLGEHHALYLTAYTAGNTARRAQLVKLADDTEINSFVIDLKDSTGRVFYPTEHPLAQEIGAVEIRINDLAEWVKELKQHQLYLIARIVVFQDPWLAEQRHDLALLRKTGGVWRDRKGLAWVNPSRQEVWEYNLDLAEEAVSLGFDEVNFDYVRFPSDGDIRQIDFQLADGVEKHHVMRHFYARVGDRFTGLPARSSADLFGMTLWRADGLNIGQRLEDAAPYFDYIMPMVYPSHYPPGFEDFANPAEHPYDVVYRSLVRAPELAGGGQAIIRPWLQDFDLGADYTAALIQDQFRATQDSGGVGWALWNARNVYTSEALSKE